MTKKNDKKAPSKQVLLYGLTGAETQYRVAAYHCIFEDDISIANITRQARMMQLRNPSIEKVYAIDNRRGLKKDYVESYKKNTIESCAIFKDLLEREGLEVI